METAAEHEMTSILNNVTPSTKENNMTVCCRVPKLGKTHQLIFSTRSQAVARIADRIYSLTAADYLVICLPFCCLCTCFKNVLYSLSAILLVNISARIIYSCCLQYRTAVLNTTRVLFINTNTGLCLGLPADTQSKNAALAV